MNSEDKRDSVKKDYDLIAEQYAKDFGTYIEDLDIYAKFEEHLPKEAIILDLGAGTGRTYSYFNEKGYSYINLNCVYEEGWTLEHAKILYEQLKLLADFLLEDERYNDIYLSIFEQKFFAPKDPSDTKNWCGGTGEMLSVDWKGDYYPCIRYMESSLGDDIKPMIIGNVDTGILCTEDQCKTCTELNCIDRRTQSTDECFNCPIANGCSWCSAYNYQVFGTPNKRATFICPMHKARALANAYYWNMMFRLSEPTKRFKIYIPEEWALEIIDEDEWEFLKLLESNIDF
jgi:radical SAM protein with 4Fe4S-binding SPASM domain